MCSCAYLSSKCFSVLGSHCTLLRGQRLFTGRLPLQCSPSCPVARMNRTPPILYSFYFINQVESSGVFKFWTELLFLCLVWVCPGGLKGLRAQFCISSWSQQPHQGPSRCTPSILLRGWFLSPDRVNAVAAPPKRGRACPAIL